MSRWHIGLLGMSIALAACGGKVVDDPEADPQGNTEATVGPGAGGEACYLPDGTLCPSGTWCDQPDTCERCFCDDARWQCEGAPCGSSVTTLDAGQAPVTNCDVPSNGCDYCGNVTCPTGTLLDSACRCLAEGHGYVTPISQTCDFCCGKTCVPGQFLDFECKCYGP